MPSAWKMEIRPRSAGEILDDAWRLYFSAPLLLTTLTALFTGPFLACLLLLLIQPPPTSPGLRSILPAVTAVLLPVTGLGSAACQEVFRRRADGWRAALLDCLADALRGGARHVAARAIIFLPLATGFLLVLLATHSWTDPVIVAVATAMSVLLILIPGLAVWVATTTVHPILAATEVRLVGALNSGSREVQRYSGKVVLVLLCRPLLLLFAVLNLHLFLHMGLWLGESLAGLDVPYLKLLMSLGNRLYDTILVLLAWLLLSPYAEACNYLLHIDARVRFEGLDLWHRVQRLFPTPPKSRAGLVLLALAAGLTFAGNLHAAPGYEVVHAARHEVTAIKQEAVAAEPFPGAARWLPRLRSLADRLGAAKAVNDGPNSWFRKRVESLANRPRAGFLQGLEELERQLALLEESLTPQPENGSGGPALSPEQIKALLPAKPAEDVKEPKDEDEAPPPPDEKQAPSEEGNRAGGRAFAGGPGLVDAQPGGDMGQAGWMVLIGLLAAVLLAAGVLFWQGRDRTPARQQAATIELKEVSLESALAAPDQHTGTLLWRQADDLARRGRFLEAVRTLYLAVLAHLHWAKLIRYERTRTNGEYVRQLRPRAAVHQPFQRMTSLFEVKWYGERSCQPNDYARCREMAEEVRSEVEAAK